MKIVSVKQNSQEWREWRGKGLGASNAPTIMGVSPWCSPFELWLEMTGIKARAQANEFAIRAMARGNQLEARARKLFETQMGNEFPALSASHDECEYVRASFDGYNKELNALLEIKCPGKMDHDKAKAGKVPDKYYPQLQQQLLVSGADVCYYFSWDGKSKEGATIKVEPNRQYMDDLLQALKLFWHCVQEKKSPEVSPRDIKKLVDEQADLLAQSAIINKVLALLT